MALTEADEYVENSDPEHDEEEEDEEEHCPC